MIGPWWSGRAKTHRPEPQRWNRQQEANLAESERRPGVYDLVFKVFPNFALAEG